MGKARILAGLAVLFPAILMVWQYAACQISNQELQSDLQDLAAQVGARIGLDAMHSDDDLRAAVICKAAKYDIDLKPEQITVRRSGSGDSEVVLLAVDYQLRVNLLIFSFTLHFNPTSVR
jgi:hypothetical protein